jgi:hypothetical protein
VYRAIADYVDLYMNKEEEYEYSVPVGTTVNNGTTKVSHLIVETNCVTILINSVLFVSGFFKYHTSTAFSRFCPTSGTFEQKNLFILSFILTFIFPAQKMMHAVES